MFYGRTIYHGLAFLGVHSFPVFGSVAYLYTQYFNCRDNTSDCNTKFMYYEIGVYTIIALVVLFQILHTLFVYLLWKKRIWPLVYEFKYSRHNEIKEMHAIYEVQFPLFHAKIMIIGLWVVAYLFIICGIDLVLLTKRLTTARNVFINYQVPFNIMFLYYSFFMLKGVRDEKNYLMYIVYVGNFIQALLLYFDLSSFCRKLNLNSTKIKTTSQCFNYSISYNTFFLYACLCWILLALSTWNTIRCHRNFNRHMSFYIKYEPTPPEFKSGRKPVVRRGSIELDYSKFV
ncbi:hypothetical protein GLOIN_2v1648258 [Rhizophagus clarus]|uniref:Uncharacterized protein n=1 Tax=Rhizophagus clarus TaxID=94130 RepID=A0A8H3R2L6_9GLOM|nr:hypothetical protein GLOIN_2v1648258 [Rhizophagus clarus]